MNRLSNWRPTLDLPHPHRAIIGGTGEQFSVGAPSDLIDPIGMTTQRRTYSFSTLRIPKPDCAIARGTCQLFPIRTPGYAVYRTVMVSPSRAGPVKDWEKFVR